MGDTEREAAILARCEAATKGPWATDPDDGLEDYRVVRDTPEWRASQGVVAEVVIERFGFGQDDNETNDAEFCAHAREDVPWLLAQLTAARERVRALEGMAWDYAEFYHDTYCPDSERHAEGCVRLAARVAALTEAAGRVGG